MNSPITENAYPHNGELLQNYFIKHKVNKAQLARRLGVAPTSITKYPESKSLQLGILWKVSQALNHNFVAELGEQLQVEYHTARELALEKELSELKKQLEKMEIELSVYKNIVGK